MSKEIQDLIIPDVNWDKVALDKDNAREIAEKGVRFLLQYAMAKDAGFMKVGMKQEAQKIAEKLDNLMHDYSGFFRVVQKEFLEQAKEIAAKDDDSKTLFERLKVLLLEGLAYGSVQRWDEADLGRVKYDLKRDFLSKIRMGSETWYILPRDWKSKTHKTTALLYKELRDKATRKWMNEKGIESKSEEKKEPQKPKSQPKPKAAPKPKTTAKPQSKKKDEADVKAAKRTKAVKVEDEGKEAEKEIRDAKKGISLANDPDALDFLKK